MLKVQKRLAAQILKCGKNRISLDNESSEEIKEAITKKDIRVLINKGVISRKRLLNTSRFWARKIKSQKRLGKQRSPGSRKGKGTARSPPKRKWINKIRLQRRILKSLRDKEEISVLDYHQLYMKSKGGFFRNKNHLKTYIEEHGIAKKNEK